MGGGMLLVERKRLQNTILRVVGNEVSKKLL